jgi:hypothetical protein
VTSNPETDRQHNFLAALFEVLPHHMVPTLLLWCGISILLATQIRKTSKRIRWSMRHGHHDDLLPLLQSVSATTSAVLLTTFVVAEHYDWVDAKQAEAEVAYRSYCHRLPASEIRQALSRSTNREADIQQTLYVHGGCLA